MLQSWFTNVQQASPSKEALSFLSDIQSGNLSKTVRHFGTNVCHCPKKKGWGAYLAYQTDEEPNLAFLLGHPFAIGEINTKQVPSPPQASHGIPWEHPEDYIVNVQLKFDKNKYSPLFLPLPMSYGKTMTWQEVENFVQNPAADYWKSFSLRLRSGLDKDAIKFDPSTIDPYAPAEFKFVTPQKIANKDLSWYITPKDAGAVVLPDGSKITTVKLAQVLPRLSSTTLQLKIVRLGNLQPWTVAGFELVNSTLDKNSKLINLTDQR